MDRNDAERRKRDSLEQCFSDVHESKGVTEYKKRYGWKDSGSPVSPDLRAPGAGLRSDQLGITKEPSFTSKKRVPFYRPLISRSFQWEQGDGSERSQPAAAEERPLSPERTETPPAPRVPRLPRSPSEDLNPQPFPVANGKNLPSSDPDKHCPTRTAAAAERSDAGLDGVHRVMQKKAGLKSTVRRSAAQNSEYQRQFSWKTAPVSSPLLAAEQVIYNRNRDVPPFKSDAVVLESEYKKNFKGLVLPKGPRLRRDVEEREAVLYEPENISPDKTPKSKKNKKGGSTKHNNTSSVPHPRRERERQVSRKQNPKRPFFPHRGCGKQKSEYSANFRSPLLYRYKDGAWIKSPCVGEEVKELRERAEAYKKRAWGTHFSREHLSQILSEQNRLWEVNSSSTVTEDTVSDTVNALDLARARDVKRSPSPVSPGSLSPVGNAKSRTEETEQAGLHSRPTLPVQRRLAWEQEDRGPESKGEEQGEHTGDLGRQEEEQADGNKKGDDAQAGQQQKEVKATEQRSSSRSSSDVTAGSSETSSDGGGRLPTPKMKTSGVAQRTHHDLTTPATGGAILVSPPKQKPSPQRVPRKSEPPLGKPYSPYKHLARDSSPPQNPSKAEERCSSQSPPAAGLKTTDPIPLRVDSWPSDSPHKAQTSPTAAKPFRKHSASLAPVPAGRTPACRIQGALRDPEFQHNGNLGDLRPGLFAFSSNDSDISDNDDRMSQISSRSAASSSLASEILERAQRRKENFWGKS
nr:PREDICTED: nuclear protein MDM1 isoform X2 [Lepisosteus oculatus]